MSSKNKQAKNKQAAEIKVAADQTAGAPGPATNADTGVVTQPGEPLPPIVEVTEGHAAGDARAELKVETTSIFYLLLNSDGQPVRDEKFDSADGAVEAAVVHHGGLVGLDVAERDLENPEHAKFVAGEKFNAALEAEAKAKAKADADQFEADVVGFIAEVKAEAADDEDLLAAALILAAQADAKKFFAENPDRRDAAVAIEGFERMLKELAPKSAGPLDLLGNPIKASPLFPGRVTYTGVKGPL